MGQGRLVMGERWVRVGRWARRVPERLWRHPPPPPPSPPIPPAPQFLTVTSSTFDSNVAYQYGGAVSVYASSNAAAAASTLDLSSSRFRANSVVKKNEDW